MDEFSYKSVSKLGFILIFIVFGLFGAWAVFAKMDLSVQAPGEIIVKSHPKEIKHQKGGVVEKIYVKEGDFVKKGEPLVKLKTTQLKKDLESNQNTLYHLIATKDRIKAELEKSKLTFSSNLPEEIKKEEEKIYQTRIKNLNEKIKNLNEKIQTISSQIEALKNQKETKTKLLDSYKKELQNWQELYNKGYAKQDKIINLQREILKLEGDIKEIESQIEQKRLQINELKTQIELTKSEYKKDLLSKLKDVSTKIPIYKAKVESLEDEINNSTIYAPSSGIVQNMKIHTTSDVISPYKTFMQVIPKSDKLIVQAYISPMDIEKVKVGEKAEINFASYVDPSAKPIEGVVIYVSPDIIKDEKDPNKQYYKAYIEITPKGMEAIKENNFKIIPGMPVTVFIKAGERTFISYILYPLQQLLKGAFHAN